MQSAYFEQVIIPKSTEYAKWSLGLSITETASTSTTITISISVYIYVIVHRETQIQRDITLIMVTH